MDVVYIIILIIYSVIDNMFFSSIVSFPKHSYIGNYICTYVITGWYIASYVYNWPVIFSARKLLESYSFDLLF